MLTIVGFGCLLLMSFFDMSPEVDGLPLSAGLTLPIMVLLAFFLGRMYKLSLIWRRHKKKFVNIAKLEFIFSGSLLACSFLILVVDFAIFASSYFFIQGILFLAYSVIIFNIFPGTRKNFRWLLENLRPSLLLTSATVIYGLSFYFDRFILLNYFGLTEIGNYAFLLFILNVGAAVITYGLQPIRAHIAASITLSDSLARQNIVTNICKMAGLYILVVGMIAIHILAPAVLAVLNNFFGKYGAAIMDVRGVFNILLTLPVLYLLGYLVVSKPYSNTEIFSLSQFSGITCVAIIFLMRGPNDSIYAVLLMGIFFGNLLKILIYALVIIKQEKWGYQSLYQFLLLIPFFMVPIFQT